MSPLLFLSVVEGLNKLTNKAMLGPYTTHTTPILLLWAPQKPTTIIVMPLHQNCYIMDVG